MGPVVGTSIAGFFSEPHNRVVVPALREQGVRLEERGVPLAPRERGERPNLRAHWRAAAPEHARKQRRGSEPQAARSAAACRAGQIMWWWERTPAANARRPGSSISRSSTRGR